MARTNAQRGEAHRAAASPERVLSVEIGFEALYQDHHRDVYRYVLAMVRSHADADDITAETFERAYRSWQSSRPPDGRILPWLLLTARRISTDRWRRLKRLVRLASVTTVDRDPESTHRKTEFWLWFDALSKALPARQREVLVLRYQRDLSDTDIARILGLTESGVRSLVARALDSLRRHPELLP